MKRIFIFALAAIISVSALTFSGCGENEEQNVEQATSATDTSEPKSTSETTKPTESETISSTAGTEPTSETVQATTSATSRQANQNNSNGTNNSSSSGNTAVTSVSLSKGSLTVNVGGSQSFEVYINPETAADRQYNVVTNNGNATVSCNGSTVTVYGENKGSCEITVSSTNGKTAVCNVSVVNNTSSGSNSGGSSGGGNSGNNGNSGGNSNNSNSGAVTDDTLLPRNQLITKANMDKLVNSINNHFSGKGATYDSSFNKNNRGWFILPMNIISGDYNYSVNSLSSEGIDYFENELYGAFVSNPQMDINRRYEIRFKCYYEQLGQNDFDIYFCYG